MADRRGMGGDESRGGAAEGLWSGTEAASYLGVPYNTLRYWAYVGTGPRSYRLGRHRHYRKSDLDAWIETKASD